MQNAFANYELPKPKKTAYYQWQQQALDAIQELKIPKHVHIKDKPMNLHSIIFRAYKRRYEQTEAFRRNCKGSGRYFVWCLINYKKF